MNLIKVLRRCEMFLGLDDSDLEKIAGLSSCRRNTYGAGEFVFYENAEANDFCILEEGEVSLLVTVHNEASKELTQVRVDTVTKGDVFGWSSLVAPHSLTLSALCVKPSSVVIVAGTELSQLMDSNHSLGYEVMKGLVRIIGARLRDLRRRLVAEDKLAGQRRAHRVVTS